MSSAPRKHVSVILLILSALIIAAFTYKAANASLTHDEAGTYLNFVDIRFDLWPCHSAPGCWANASNHLLNTWLIRRAVDVFGVSELSIRLPNLLFLALFMYVCTVFFTRMSRHTLMAVAGLGMVCFNPYVLDFFALARGYGMGLGAMMISLILIWHFLRTHNIWSFAGAVASAAIAVFCNLIFAASTIAFFAALGICVARRSSSGRSSRFTGRWYIMSAIAISCLALLAFYFARPVQYLSAEGEFLYGAATFSESWMEFMRDSLYGRAYLGRATVVIAGWISALLVIIAAGSMMLRHWSDTKADAFPVFMSIFSVLLLASFILNHWIFDAWFPEGRKSIIYGPPLALTVWLWVRQLKLPQRWSISVFGAIGLLSVLHLTVAYDSTTYREWWYDASTKDMVHRVADERPFLDSSVTLCTEWIFHPSSKFYISTEDLPLILAPRDNIVRDTASCDFYYVHPEHADRLSENYEVYVNFNGRLLFEHKARAGATRAQ